jgi:hypothetical protein
MYERNEQEISSLSLGKEASGITSEMNKRRCFACNIMQRCMLYRITFATVHYWMHIMETYSRTEHCIWFSFFVSSDLWQDDAMDEMYLWTRYSYCVIPNKHVLCVTKLEI